MKTYLAFVLGLLSATLTNAKPADTAKVFLNYLYGADGVDLNAICHPHDDLWMLAGVKNPQGLAAVAAEKIKISDPGIFAGLIERDFCIVEVRDGKADPQFNLEQVYALHRQVILQFLYFSLLQDRQELEKRVTHVSNVSFGRTKAASWGDMDVYEGLLSLIPPVRTSKPTQDRESHSVSYRLPLGKSGFIVKLVKAGNAWKIDSSDKVIVPLELFWQ